jgi:SAM-dependent methyltransferase
MSDWTAGYIADIGYTFGYYMELSPQRMLLPLLYAGLQPPQVGAACELGFGQGLSTNLNAAASPIDWHGNDFNPAHAALARELAGASGARAQLTDEAFDQFCARSDLPDFDFIGLHGIWSWISDENRHIITDFIKRKLKPGGVLYISYNTQPGWAPMVPVRELLTGHAETMGAPGVGIEPRVDAALAFAGKLLNTNPKFSSANPLIAGRIAEMGKMNRAYLAHEYFNRDWHPMSFSKINDWLGEAKLSFACSASYLDHVKELNLTPEQASLLDGIGEPTFRQTVRDFCVNQQFRRDYWVKGGRRMAPLKKSEALWAHRVVLQMYRSGIELKATGAMGECNLQEGIYAPILDALAHHKPMSLADIARATATANISKDQLVQAVFVLAGMNVLSSVQDEAVIKAARPHTRRLNAHICEQARFSADMVFLSSPVTGGGIAVNRFQQLFLLARARGLSSASQLAEYAWSVLAAQGQLIVIKGVTLTTPEENLAELSTRANLFIEKILPVLIALQVAETMPAR